MSYVSVLRPKEIVVDDHNVNSQLNALGGRGYEARNWQASPFGTLDYASPFDLPLIPRSEWPDRIEQMEKTKSRLSDIRRLNSLRSSNQANTPYCWMHGTVNAMRLARAAAGLPILNLSAASAAAPCKNFRARGGWSGEAVEWLSEHGINTWAEWPENAIDRRYYTEENKALAATRRVTEWYELSDRRTRFDELMTCLMLGFPVAVGYAWWGHLVCAVDPVVIAPGKFGARIWNSWGDNYGEDGEAVLSESKATPDDACVIRVATAANN